MIEAATFCGNDEAKRDFIIWIGIAVQSDLSAEQLDRLMDERYNGTVDIECIPYNLDFANTHGFTAIQKELAGMETWEGYYIIGCDFRPKTSVDKRNKSLQGHKK